MNKILSFADPLIMGIINLTPDSFYADSRELNPEKVLKKVSYMVDNQVDIIDLGAMSSRPGAEVISVQEELNRLLPSFKLIKSNYPDTFISIDTVHGEVAETCLGEGANMINDISANSIDKTLISAVNKYDAYYCLMHMQNLPNTMQDQPKYENVSLEVLNFLKNKAHELKNAGVNKLIIDPGFGFGKTVENNYQLLKDLSVFKILDLPLLVGLSRKSMIYKPLNIEPEGTLPATTALHLLALQQGANILRVHDVREAKQAVKLYKLLNN